MSLRATKVLTAISTALAIGTVAAAMPIIANAAPKAEHAVSAMGYEDDCYFNGCVIPRP